MAKKRKPPRLPGGGRTFVPVQAMVNDREKAYQRNFARQFVTDAACLAVHDTFGAAEIGQEKFLASLGYWLMEMSELTLEDAKDDKDLVYMKTKLDEALKPILGNGRDVPDERISR